MLNQPQERANVTLYSLFRRLCGQKMPKPTVVEEQRRSEPAPLWMMEGVRVVVKQTAGFHKGAHGVIKFVVPSRDTVWVLRDRAGSEVWYSPDELEPELPMVRYVVVTYGDTHCDDRAGMTIVLPLADINTSDGTIKDNFKHNDQVYFKNPTGGGYSWGRFQMFLSADQSALLQFRG